MKIAIVGGGISGLSTYLFLRKHLSAHPPLKDAFDITVYEPHDLPSLGSKRADNIPSSGGGYGLGANGMASIRRLDPALHDQIVRNGFASPKTVMKSARGWTLGVMPFTDLRGEHPECCIMVLREVVIAALYERVDASAVVHQKVIRVENGNAKATIHLSNGEQHEFDMVIGADGVWSKARHAVLPDSVAPEYRYEFYDY
jgi:2-polyprenyl-6-methoxyphenol hydroxylase-like FAD-dependent oxidoreductase